jgi:hypothetical protein
MTTYTAADFIPLTLTRGSDLVRTITVDPAWGDITGWTFPVSQVVPSGMASVITCAVTNGPAGIATLTALWGDGTAWPTGTGLAKVTFYTRPSARDEAFPQFRVGLE